LLHYNVCILSLFNWVKINPYDILRYFCSIIDLLINVAFISVVPEIEILGGRKVNETIAATFFSKLFNGSDAMVRIFTFLIVLSVIGTAASNIWR